METLSAICIAPLMTHFYLNSRKQYIICGILFVLIAALIAGRFYLGVWLFKYVNDEVNNIPGYEGSVESIDIHLYRGAYRIHHLKINKENGHIPAPFIDIKQADLSIEWSALFHGRIVSNIELFQPVINFAVNNGIAQNGADVDWTQPIKKLMPVDINRVTFREGKLTYQHFSSHPEVNIYINHMQGESTNLRNVVDKSKALPSTLYVKGDSIGKGKLEIKGRMNILKQVPDMDLDMKLENVYLPALNDYSNAYAAIDIKKGDLNVYSELIIKDGHVSGYIKPIATHISLIDLRKDANPVKVAWEAVVSLVLKVFTNLRKDQFATKADLQGDISHISTDTWSTISGIIRNAFISAMQKGFEEDNRGALSPEAIKNK